MISTIPRDSNRIAKWLRWLAVSSTMLSLFVATNVLVSETASAQLRRDQDDIVVNFDDPWPAISGGGYYPVNMTIENRGPDASIEIFTDKREIDFFAAPRVKKSISLAQNAKTRLTLLLPLVTFQDNANIGFKKNGRQLKSLNYKTNIAVGDPNLPSLLAVSDTRPKLHVLQTFADTVLQSRRTSGGTHYSGSSAAVGNCQPGSLPDTWLAYSGLEAVVCEANGLIDKTSESQQVELIRWVKSGGHLIVYSAKPLAEDRRTLLNNILSSNGVYLDRDSGLAESAAYGGKYRGNGRLGGNSGRQSRPVESWASGFGQVRVADFDPFEENHWMPLFFNKSASSKSWLERNGMSTRFGCDDFLQFVDQGVRKIPTVPFIILITLFAGIIGPVNYIMLRRRNRVAQLLWTTPLIALVACVLLIGWSMVANGTSNKVRLRSFSILDQGSQSIVSKTRASLFSGVTPKGGLRFEPFTAAYPVWPSNDRFQVGSVDWTDAQVMSGNFHQGNSRSQFLLTTPRTERGRVQVGTANDQGLPITNGLEWSIAKIILRDSKGDLYYGTDVWQGEAKVLTRINTEQYAKFSDQLNEQSLRPPRVGNTPSNDYGSSRYYGMETSISTNMSSNQMEEQFTVLETWLRNQNMRLPNNSYIAILVDNPGLDIGLETFNVTEQLHVLMGYY